MVILFNNLLFNADRDYLNPTLLIYIIGRTSILTITSDFLNLYDLPNELLQNGNRPLTNQGSPACCDCGFSLFLLLSMKSITVPPMSAIIPLTIKMVAINKPEKAKPTVIPMLLRDSLTAVWLTLRV